jgi:hypothetical protein
MDIADLFSVMGATRFGFGAQAKSCRPDESEQPPECASIVAMIELRHRHKCRAHWRRDG